MQLAKNVYLSFCLAGKSEGNIFEKWELESNHRPRFGRNWWFWKPSFRTNGGRFKCHENTDLNANWLCFNVSFTVYSWKKLK